MEKSGDLSPLKQSLLPRSHFCLMLYRTWPIHSWRHSIKACIARKYVKYAKEGSLHARVQVTFLCPLPPPHTHPKTNKTKQNKQNVSRSSLIFQRTTGSEYFQRISQFWVYFQKLRLKEPTNQFWILQKKSELAIFMRERTTGSLFVPFLWVLKFLPSRFQECVVPWKFYFMGWFLGVGVS